MIQRRKKLAFSIFIFTSYIISCRQAESSTKYREVETVFFSITLPTNQFNVVYSTDSLQGKIILDRDTVLFNIGFDINTLTEIEPKVLFVPSDGITDKKSLVDPRIVDTTNLLFADRDDFDMDIYRKQNVFFTQVNDLKIKNTFPRTPGNGGIVGIYCDSLKTCFSGGRLKFSIYKKETGNVHNDSIFLKSLMTIQFKKKPMCY
jgi:hypothetical protein